MKGHIKIVLYSVPFYDLLKQALTKHNEGKHGEAVNIYCDLIDKGCKLAFYNLGNCYLFGVGVEKDGKKGLELFQKGSVIEGDDFVLMNELSNSDYMKKRTLDLGVSFYSITLNVFFLFHLE